MKFVQPEDAGHIVTDDDGVFRGEVRFHDGAGELAFVTGDTVLTQSDLMELLKFIQDAGRVKDERPHSRACGIAPHEHGPACSRDCPTCYVAKAPHIKPADIQVDFGNGPL